MPQEIQATKKTIGEVITGEKIQTTPYKFILGEKKPYTLICTKKYDENQKAYLTKLIDDEYYFNFIFDNISCSSKSTQNQLIPGISIGYIQDKKHYVNSDLAFLIHLSSLTGETTINGFDVISAKPTINSNTPVALEDDQEIKYRFSITFDDAIQTTDIIRNQRFTHQRISPRMFLLTLLSVIISFFIPVIIISWVSYSDNSEIDIEYDEYEGYEWKLIHGDVFRSPNRPSRLTMFFGWGIQIFLSILLTIIQVLMKVATTQLASILTAFVNSMIISAFFGGFLSMKMFKTIGTSKWKSAMFSSSFIPIAIAAIILFVFSLRMKKLSSVSFSVSTVILYFVLDSVLYFAGSLVGLKSKPFELKQKVNQLPRQIPPYNTEIVRNLLMIIGPIFVFSLIYIYITIFFQLVWSYNGISISGTCVFLGLILCVLQSADLGIIVTFFLISKEDYRWWWPSFVCGSSVGLCFMIYSILYGITNYVPKDGDAFFIYFGTNAIFSCMLSLLCGAFSFSGAFFFVKSIYNSLKME